MPRFLLRYQKKYYLWLPNITVYAICIIQWCFMPVWGLIPMFDKLALFYWLIHRPDRISLTWLSLFYFFPDILEGWPLGFSSILMLLCAWTTLLQRHLILQQSFLFQWIFVTIIIVIYLTGFSSIYWMSMAVKLPLANFTISAIVVLLLYPLLAWCLFKVQKFVPAYVSAEV